MQVISLEDAYLDWSMRCGLYWFHCNRFKVFLLVLPELAASKDNLCLIASSQLSCTIHSDS